MAATVGQKAPAFSAKDQSGATVTQATYAGKYVVLYFYPKDNTPGCTVEACAFRDDSAKLKAAGAVVLGVSPDSEKSHQKFIEKFSLPFQLLVDTDNTLSTAYGAWGEKSMYGRSYMGVVRSTFLIGPDGKLAHVWPKVKVEGHSDDVLATIQALKAGKPAPAAPTKVTKAAKVTKAKAAPKKPAAKAKKAAPKKR
ncbi:MAG: thioredoxin-dependent thiol peroxidase [Myxococcales bacterium]|nr:thioredoxin-dependent thiol peroxidase [Myxococcales bacterium]MDP3500747.1 thioredoxin-dependent thiol peroxidase [Myxococcales bacterium]